MKKNFDDVVHRAWNRLRLALLCVRKSKGGGALRRRLEIMELRLVPKYLKCLGHASSTSPPTDQTSYYYERELSFDKTPVFHVKMHRPSSMRFHIPCINPQVDHFDHDDDQEAAEIDKRAEEFIAKFYQQMKLQRQISYLQNNIETPNRDST